MACSAVAGGFELIPVAWPFRAAFPKRTRKHNAHRSGIRGCGAKSVASGVNCPEREQVGVKTNAPRGRRCRTPGSRGRRAQDFQQLRSQVLHRCHHGEGHNAGGLRRLAYGVAGPCNQGQARQVEVCRHPSERQLAGILAYHPASHPPTINSLMREASASMANGLVNTCMPGSR